MNRFRAFVTQLLAVALLATSLTVVPVSAQAPAPAKVNYPIDRSVLPIKEPNYPHETELDARKATAPTACWRN